MTERKDRTAMVRQLHDLLRFSGAVLTAEAVTPGRRTLIEVWDVDGRSVHLTIRRDRNERVVGVAVHLEAGAMTRSIDEAISELNRWLNGVQVAAPAEVPHAS
jgi:predicted acetyltransferase